MKPPLPICHCLPLLAAVLLTTAGAWAQDAPEPSPTPGRTKRAALENELAMYSPFESPWADIKADHTFESRLFNLLRAEVRLWTLQDTLTAQNSPEREDAGEVSHIVHEQILAAAADALPILQKTPNKAFALLLVHQLEAYPYEWQEEGSEQVLPGLHRLVDPTPGGSPAPRQRRPR